MTYRPERNYCTLFPDKMFGVNYNYGCYLHDRHYRNERITRLTRKGADLLLKNKVFDYFKKVGMIKFGKFWSNLMYFGVRIIGRFYWK